MRDSNMLQLDKRYVDSFGRILFKVDDLPYYIKKGYDVSRFLIEDSVKSEQLVNTANLFDNQVPVPSIATNDARPIADYRNNWHHPDEYNNIDIKKFLLEKCKTQIEIDRVNDEYNVFEKYELIDLLRMLIYIVDKFKENKILWGVGRGSSVSSYILFLIGIHRIDSIKYALDFKEFLE
jgi:DNA polymerase III alpha subunit